MSNEQTTIGLKLNSLSLITYHASLLLKRLAEKPPHVLENLVEEG
jgi:hypothetical protein